MEEELSEEMAFAPRPLVESWDDLVSRDRIGFRPNGKDLDEIVLTGMAHLEQMDKSSFYLGLYRPNGSGYQVWLYADKKGRLNVSYEELERRSPPLSKADGR